jgi:ribosomal protein S18 acetylase RimI-like enzyme
MLLDPSTSIVDYSPEHQPSIRKILTRIGWAEQYISGMESALDVFSKDRETYGVYLAVSNGEAVGYLYVQYYAWNQLCQIQGLAVSPDFQRRGIASALVARAEEFAKAKHARGVYVDTPTNNLGGRKFYEAIGYQLGYIMPRYYEDKLDGVTYQKFFTGIQTNESDQTHSS